jgi:ADP-heptose:LPS heptosyltransferase
MQQENGKKTQNILVIKLGALGDFIQAMGPMAAIRRQHPDAQITLLTTAPFASFGRDCGYFNDIWIDEKPSWFNFAGWRKLAQKLNQANFSRVYDLQNNDRTALYFKLFPAATRPEWVGAAKGASHRNNSPERTAGHAFDGHAQTLALVGIQDVAIDALAWMQGDIASFALRKPYIILVPGSAPDRPEKRWPAGHYGQLCNLLNNWGYQPVLIGTQHEQSVISKILEICPEALDLSRQTSLAQLVSLARSAAAAIGNDTGPMHLIAATGCPCIAIFSAHSDPVRHQPKGPSVQILQAENLAELQPQQIIETLKPRFDPPQKSSLLH